MMKVNGLRRISLAMMIGLLGSALTVQAAPITGLFNITGSVRVIATGVIDFLADQGPPSVLDNGFNVVPPETGMFAGLEGTRGTLQDLSIGAPPPIANWLVLQALPSLSFTLTAIDPGSFSSANCGGVGVPGQTCTPPPPAPGVSSPFNLTNLAGGSTVSFVVRGTVTDPTGPPSDWSGVFTSQFIGKTYQQVLADLAPGGPGFIEASYSATVMATPTTNPVPEPGSLSLIVGGVLALAGLRLVKQRV